MSGCTNCGSLPPPGARFCDICGTPVAGQPAPRAAAGPHPRTVADPRAHASVLSAVAAGGLGAIGAMMLLGIFVPFAGGDGFSFSLSDDNGELVVLIAISALLCVGGCVSEFFGLREGLLTGIGIVAGFTLSAVAVLIAVPTQTDLSPEIGYVIWVLAAFVGIALIVLLVVEVLDTSNAERVPTPFWACALGGGLFLTLGVLIPERGVAFSDHIVSDTPILALVNVLYAAVPTIAGIAAVIRPRRSTLTFIVGVVAWYGTSWMVASSSSGTLRFGLRDDPGLSYYVQMVAILALGLAAIGGGLVRWANGSPAVRSTRDLVLPIAACSALVLIVLFGFVAGL